MLRASAPEPAYLCMDRRPTTWEEIARGIVAELGSSSRVEITAADGASPAAFDTARENEMRMHRERLANPETARLIRGNYVE